MQLLSHSLQRFLRVEFGFVDGNNPNTMPVRLFVYDDPTDDNDPADAVLIWSDTTSYTVQNEYLPAAEGGVDTFGPLA